MTTPNSLMVLSDIQRRLATITTVEDAKSLRDQAEVIRLYAKKIKAGLEVQNRAARVKLLAERRAGELLAKTVRHQGGRPKKHSHDPSVLLPKDVSWDQSVQWQAIATVADADILQREAKHTAAGTELTSYEIYSEVMAEQRDEVKRARRTAAAEAAQENPTDSDTAVRHESLETTAATLDPDSVSLIFTDPPYHDATLPIYATLGTVAARVLKDGASLITYTSHHRIPEVIRMLQDAGLTFFWPLAVIYTSGNLARMTEYGIIVHWKPLLWFVKGTFRSRDDMRWVHDVIESPQAEKTHHPWQQEVASALHYIDALTQPGDLVFDPFCGGGTTVVAAAQLQRRYITCDIDEESVWIARQRLRDCHV